MKKIFQDTHEHHSGISLARALRLQPGAVVSFVGGGGKTTALFRLAAELARDGRRVVTTTTTRIFESQVALAPGFLPVTELAGLRARLDEWGHCLVIGTPDGEGKVRGISCETVADLHARSEVDFVLVEADGSRIRSFKAPAEHEPVVPSVTTHLVPVVGVDIIGCSLDDAHVHRPELVAALTRRSVGDTITSEIVAQVLGHPEGGAKHRPPHAQLLPLVNKVEDESGLAHAHSICEELMACPAVDSISVGSVKADLPVLEVWSRVAGIVLAAGQARRFGSPKQLMAWRDTTLVGHVARVGLEAGLDPVVVVTGYEADRVAAAVASLSVETVFNPTFAAGQSTSIRFGLAALPARAAAAVFLLADQPAVTPLVVKEVVRRHRSTLAPIVVPLHEGQAGNPVLFDCSLFAELEAITGDTGGRALFEKHRQDIASVAVDEPGILQDIDTPADYDH